MWCKHQCCTGCRTHLFLSVLKCVILTVVLVVVVLWSWTLSARRQPGCKSDRWQ